jgi:ABC-type bacteriocin/lantibiotic exporter with double-glycine peptidase domain
MKPVVQEERTGCGIAAVATLAGVTYQDARRAAGQLGIVSTDPRLWSDTTHVRRLLARYHLRPAKSETPFRSWETLPSLALLAIKWHRVKGRDFWHWVVFWRGPDGPVVLDPKRALRTHRRSDFGRMKPKWFLAVAVPRSHANRSPGEASSKLQQG